MRDQIRPPYRKKNYSRFLFRCVEVYRFSWKIPSYHANMTIFTVSLQYTRKAMHIPLMNGCSSCTKKQWTKRMHEIGPLPGNSNFTSPHPPLLVIRDETWRKILFCALYYLHRIIWHTMYGISRRKMENVFCTPFTAGYLRNSREYHYARRKLSKNWKNKEFIIPCEIWCAAKS